MRPAACASVLFVCAGLAACAGASKPAARPPDSETAAAFHGLEWDPRASVIRCPDRAEVPVPPALAGLVRQQSAAEVTIVTDDNAAGSALLVTMTDQYAGFWGRLPAIWAKVHQLASGRSLADAADGGTVNGNLQMELNAVETEYERLGRRWTLVYVESKRCQAAAVDPADGGAPRLTPLVRGLRIPPNLLDEPQRKRGR